MIEFLVVDHFSHYQEKGKYLSLARLLRLVYFGAVMDLTLNVGHRFGSQQPNSQMLDNNEKGCHVQKLQLIW